MKGIVECVIFARNSCDDYHYESICYVVVVVILSAKYFLRMKICTENRLVLLKADL